MKWPFETCLLELPRLSVPDLEGRDSPAEESTSAKVLSRQFFRSAQDTTNTDLSSRECKAMFSSVPASTCKENEH